MLLGLVVVFFGWWGFLIFSLPFCFTISIALGSSVAQIFRCYRDKNITTCKLDMIYEALVCLNSQSLVYQFVKIIYKYFRNNIFSCL